MVVGRCIGVYPERKQDLSPCSFTHDGGQVCTRSWQRRSLSEHQGRGQGQRCPGRVYVELTYCLFVLLRLFLQSHSVWCCISVGSKAADRTPKSSQNNSPGGGETLNKASKSIHNLIVAYKRKCDIAERSERVGPCGSLAVCDTNLALRPGPDSAPDAHHLGSGFAGCSICCQVYVELSTARQPKQLASVSPIFSLQGDFAVSLR